MTTISGFEINTRLVKSGQKSWPWQGPVCAACGQDLQRISLNLPRHLAGELLRESILDGEAERVFFSTRNDLGWSVEGWACPSCKQFFPTQLRQAR